MTARHLWINGQITLEGDAGLSPFDHGLLYGDGIFEGIRFYERVPFRLRAHLERLARSAAALALTIPYPLDELAAAAYAMAERAEEPDGYLRLIVTRGPGTLGLSPASCRRPTVLLLEAPIAVYDVPASGAAGLSVITAATRQTAADALDPRVKSLNYLPRVLARIEAERAGADEALLLNARGFLTEGTADNLFTVTGGVLATPPASDGALDGITRGVLLELAHAAGIPSQVTSLATYDLYAADEVFLCGTAAELVPVRAVDGRAVPACPGPIFQHLAATFRDLVTRETRAAARTVAFNSGRNRLSNSHDVAVRPEDGAAGGLSGAGPRDSRG
jgi:branched-chain amino acid aminotransferase